MVAQVGEPRVVAQVGEPHLGFFHTPDSCTSSFVPLRFVQLVAKVKFLNRNKHTRKF